MIRIVATEPKNETWCEWRRRAKMATDELIAGRATAINDELYKEQRDFILNLFHGKCAYCEVLLPAGQRYGDLDHYRPKGRVTDEQGKLVFVDGRQHPGYFWLAYHWSNLLPSCAGCNRPGKAPDGTKSGKWDKFPIAGIYAFTYDHDLAREQPLLLNPYEDDPDDHLTFDVRTGIVGDKTARGRKTIDILGLNREGLINERKRVARAARLVWGEYVGAIAAADSARADEHEPQIVEYEKGIAPHSSIARTVIRLGREALRNRGLG